MAKPLNLVIVEDSEEDARLTVRQLEQAGWAPTVTIVGDAPTLAAQLSRQPCDIVLSDCGMPGFSAEQALRVVRQRDLDVPFVIVSGTIGEEAAVALLKAGANDYVLKSNSIRLPSVIERELREADLRRRHRAVQEQNERLQLQLLRAAKMDALGRMAAGTAHDFNNLLAAVMGFTELIKMSTELSGRHRNMLDDIHNACGSAAVLVRRLLTFGRRDVTQRQIVDPDQVLLGCENLIRGAVGGTIEVVLLRNSTNKILADPAQLEQAILNLALNARDSMPNGGQLTVETKDVIPLAEESWESTDAVAMPHVMIAVSDTGIGMTDEVKSHLFEPFYTTKGPDRGSGLGLPTVYGIVRQCRGQISVQSEPDKGTTFRMYFPAAAHDAADSSPAEAR